MYDKVSKWMLYRCVATTGDWTEVYIGDYIVTVKTEKQMKLESKKADTYWGKNDSFRIKFDNRSNDIGKDWGDGTFTIYPNRSWTPFVFNPITWK